MKLVPSSALKAPLHAFELQRLVRDERDQLEVINPGLIRRTRDYPHALRNVMRVHEAKSLHVFYVPGRRLAFDGIATVITGHRMMHPEEGFVAGHDLEYWLRQDASDDRHREVARALIGVSEGIALKNGAGSHSYMVGARVDAPDQMRGLTENMETVGGPAVCDYECLENGLPDYGLAKDGAVLQLYKGRTFAR